jgi:hypothetical protein
MAEELITIFYAYAGEDEKSRKELEKHFSLLRRQGLIESWHGRDISIGDARMHEVDAYLDTAQIILLLVSANFMDSVYLYDTEIQRAMERHRMKEARVIPIILRPCDWQRAPFGKLVALPRDGKPVSSWSYRDEAFLDIASGIRRVIDDLTNPYPSTRSSSRTISSGGSKTGEISQVLAQAWNIPYSRNPFFTGRDDILDNIHTRLLPAKSTDLTQPLAIIGPSGLGKPQVVLEYAYRHLTDYYYIMWVDASTRDTILTDVMELAGFLKLPEKDEQNHDRVITAVEPSHFCTITGMCFPLS